MKREFFRFAEGRLGAFLTSLLIVVVGAIVWGATCRYSFVWDDAFFIQNNASLRSVRFLPRYFHDPSTSASSDLAPGFILFRPLRNVSWLVDYKVAGLRAGWWHLHNVLLHILNAWLVGMLAWFAVRRRDVQIVAALLFLLHPVVSETVCWVKCRDDLLSTTLILWAAILWVKWRQAPFTRSRGAVLGVLGFAACLTKESAVVLPVLLLALDLGARRVSRGDLRETARRAIPAVAAVGCFLAWRWLVLGRTGQCEWMAGTALRTWMTMVPAFGEYVRLFFMPHPLLADYSGFSAVTGWTAPSFLRGAWVLLCAAALCGIVAWRVPESRAGLVWTVSALVPVSNLVPMMQFLAERFLYLPLAGASLAVAAVVARARDRMGIGVPLATAAVLVVFAAEDIGRREVWRDDMALFSATAQDAPGALRPRRNLIRVLFNAGRYAEALPVAREVWRKSRTEVSEPRSRKLEDAVNYATALLLSGREEEGRAMLEALLREQPDAGWPHMFLGIGEARKGNIAAALVRFETARERLVGEPEVLNNLGMALRDLGREDEAKQVFRSAIEMPSAGRGPYLNLAALLWKKGDIRAAAGVYRKMLVRWPGDPEAKHWLAEAERK